MPEIAKISEFCRNTWRNNDLADLIIGGAWTGARQCELLNMKVGDVQWERNVIFIGGRKDFKTKASTVAEIPIIGNSPLVSILKERTRDLPTFEYVFGNDWKSRHQVRYHWQNMIEFCMPDKAYPIKQLRHTFCTALITLGVPLPVVQQLANHKSYDTTLRYARATDEAKREGLNKLTDAYGSMMSLQQTPTHNLSLNKLSLAVEA
jgi:integrase